jgi:hypothetical protein
MGGTAGMQATSEGRGLGVLGVIAPEVGEGVEKMGGRLGRLGVQRIRQGKSRLDMGGHGWAWVEPGRIAVGRLGQGRPVFGKQRAKKRNKNGKSGPRTAGTEAAGCNSAGKERQELQELQELHGIAGRRALTRHGLTFVVAL